MPIKPVHPNPSTSFCSKASHSEKSSISNYALPLLASLGAVLALSGFGVSYFHPTLNTSLKAITVVAQALGTSLSAGALASLVKLNSKRGLTPPLGQESAASQTTLTGPVTSTPLKGSSQVFNELPFSPIGPGTPAQAGGRHFAPLFPSPLRSK